MRSERLIYGQLLVAHPLNPQDTLNQGVVLVVAHSDEVSMGIQLNLPLETLRLQTVCEGIGIWFETDEPVYCGGNMSGNKIHVVHSTDWAGMTTQQLSDDVAITSDISVLTALSMGEGPSLFRACAGRWVWHSGLLDRQLDSKNWPDQDYRWELVPATTQTVFEQNGSDQWHHALAEAAKQQVAAWF